MNRFAQKQFKEVWLLVPEVENGVGRREYVKRYPCENLQVKQNIVDRKHVACCSSNSHSVFCSSISQKYDVNFQAIWNAARNWLSRSTLSLIEIEKAHSK